MSVNFWVIQRTIKKLINFFTTALSKYFNDLTKLWSLNLNGYLKTCGFICECESNWALKPSDKQDKKTYSITSFYVGKNNPRSFCHFECPYNAHKIASITCLYFQSVFYVFFSKWLFIKLIIYFRMKLKRTMIN